jgi:hypothetical protein
LENLVKVSVENQKNGAKRLAKQKGQCLVERPDAQEGGLQQEGEEGEAEAMG